MKDITNPQLLSYMRAKFVIQTNAKGQAWADATTMSITDAMRYVSDQRVIGDVIEVLHHWVVTHDTQILFTNLDKSDYEALSEFQRGELVEYWITLYPVAVIDKLKQRLEGGSNERA